MAEIMRLDRILSNMGYGTRRQIHILAMKGLIQINDSIAKDPSIRCCPDTDKIKVNGVPVTYRKYVYYMLNKPAGIISATSGSEETVLDLIDDRHKGLFPCGRLDKDVEGLLLITNDGQLSHQLLSPRMKIEKEYYVQLESALENTQIQLIGSGLTYPGEESYEPASVSRIDERSCTITVTEGKYHEVKRLFELAGNKVIYLKRIRMKNLLIDSALNPGEYRTLSVNEIEGLKE